MTSIVCGRPATLQNRRPKFPTSLDQAFGSIDNLAKIGGALLGVEPDLPFAKGHSYRDSPWRILSRVGNGFVEVKPIGEKPDIVWGEFGFLGGTFQQFTDSDETTRTAFNVADCFC